MSLVLVYFIYMSIYNNEEKESKKDFQNPLSEKFLKTRQIILTGEVNKELAEAIATQLLILDSDDSTCGFMNIGVLFDLDHPITDHQLFYLVLAQSCRPLASADLDPAGKSRI